MDDATIMELARRMGGGHPISEVRGKQDVITAQKSKDPAVRKAEEIAAKKAELQGK